MAFINLAKRKATHAGGWEEYQGKISLERGVIGDGGIITETAALGSFLYPWNNGEEISVDIEAVALCAKGEKYAVAVNENFTVKVDDTKNFRSLAIEIERPDAGYKFGPETCVMVPKEKGESSSESVGRLLKEEVSETMLEEQELISLIQKECPLFVGNDGDTVNFRMRIYEV